MVRIIAGTLLEVGRGKMARDEIPGILTACDRTRAGLTAPAGWLVFFSSRRRHTRLTCDWSSDVCSSDLGAGLGIGISGPAIAGAGVERPEVMLKTFIATILAEALAIYGLVVGLLSIFAIPALDRKSVV